MLTTDDEDVAARAILYSGSYMLYQQHRARPADSVFAKWKDAIPNYSMRMSNLIAAVARPQVALLADRACIWNNLYGRLATQLGAIPGTRLPHRPQEEEFVQSSIQFAVAGLNEMAFARFLTACRTRGVYLKWFGAREAEGYTSTSGQWRYLENAHTPPGTEAALERLCDMRIPLSLRETDCATITSIIGEEMLALSRTLA